MYLRDCRKVSKHEGIKLLERGLTMFCDLVWAGICLSHRIVRRRKRVSWWSDASADSFKLRIPRMACARSEVNNRTFLNGIIQTPMQNRLYEL